MTQTATTLPPDARSVSAARRFVTDALAALGAPAAVEDAQVLVSELATNAVLHARSTFTVEVTRAGGTVRICVADESAVTPRTRAHGPEATTGRGMLLVASLASDWGVEPQGGRKTVWFELPAAGGGSTGRDDADEPRDAERAVRRTARPQGPVVRTAA